MSVDAATIRVSGHSGWREGADLDDELRKAKRRAGFVWISLPYDDEEAIRDIEERLGLTTRAIIAAEARKLRTRVDLIEGAEVLALSTITCGEAGRDVRRGEVTCLVTDRCAVTVEQGDAGVLDVAHEILESDTAHLEMGPASVLRAVAIAVVESAEQVNLELAEGIERLEAEVFSPGGIDSAQGIYRLKREVAQARRALTPLSTSLSHLSERDDPSLPDDSLRTLNNLASAALRCVEQIDALDAMLGDMLSAHLTMVSVRQNTDMRRISALAALVAIPTMFAGLYGMNFRHMPGLDWQWGFPVALAITAGICVVLHRLLKRAGWL